jgi:hypothetical protein
VALECRYSCFCGTDPGSHSYAARVGKSSEFPVTSTAPPEGIARSVRFRCARPRQEANERVPKRSRQERAVRTRMAARGRHRIGETTRIPLDPHGGERLL